MALRIKVYEKQEFQKVIATGLSYDDASFLQEEIQEFASNNNYAATARVARNGNGNFSIVIKSTDESELTRLPDEFNLDAVIAELNPERDKDKPSDSDDSHRFSDDYISKYVNSLVGQPWDINASNRICQELDAYIDALDEDDDGNDVIYIKNDDGFEVILTIEDGNDTDSDTVVNAEWSHL